MPIGDSRSYGTFPDRRSGKRPLGKRQAPRVDTDSLLSELQVETVQTVARVLGVGGAIQYGSTRNRTAMLVRAWVGGDQYEDYVTSVAELLATYEALCDVTEGAAARSTTP